MRTEYTDEDRLNDFDFFLENYNDLYSKYGHKFFAIRNKRVLGTFDSYEDAWKKLGHGTYILQENTGDMWGYTKTAGYADILEN